MVSHYKDLCYGEYSKTIDELLQRGISTKRPGDRNIDNTVVNMVRYLALNTAGEENCCLL